MFHQTVLVFVLLMLATVGMCERPEQEYYEEDVRRNTPLGGLIDVDVHDTGHGKHVGVHVPLFYKMDLDKEHGHRKGLGINVLEGLVKVRVRKDPHRPKDNVFVSLAGIPVWLSR